MTPSEQFRPAGEADRIRAELDGRTAALAGKPVTVCPFRVASGETETERTRFLQLMWVRGYRNAWAERDADRATRIPEE